MAQAPPSGSKEAGTMTLWKHLDSCGAPSPFQGHSSHTFTLSAGRALWVRFSSGGSLPHTSPKVFRLSRWYLCPITSGDLLSLVFSCDFTPSFLLVLGFLLHHMLYRKSPVFGHCNMKLSSAQFTLKICTLKLQENTSPLPKENLIIV